MLKHATRGFSLIELMVTTALIAILLAIVAPSLTTFQRNAELTSFANNFVSSMNAARSEAMKRGQYALVVPADGVNWSSGLIAFVDVNRTQVYDAASDTVISKREAAPGYLSISGTGVSTAAAPYIMFDAQGYSKDKSLAPSALTLNIARTDVGGSELYNQTRRIKISFPGRIRVCKPTSAADATCAATGS